MSVSSDLFDAAFEEYLRMLSGLTFGDDDMSVAAAIASAPADHPVHRLSVRTYRCVGCRRLGVLSDVALNVCTGAVDCPSCEGNNLELVAEGRA